jgi:hypothetical protein
MNIDETRWMMYHFDVQRSEDCRALRVIGEVLQTVCVIVFGIVVLSLL